MKTRIITIALSVLLLASLFGCAAAGPAPAADREQTVTTAPAVPTQLTKEEAQQIALDHAGLTAEQVTQLHVDRDDDEPKFEVEFRKDDREYEYTVHAETGEILSIEVEHDPERPPVEEPQATEPPVEEPQPTEPPVEEPQPTEPPVEEPQPTEPPVEEPQPTEPPVEEPQPTEPPVEEPQPTEPPVEEPQPTEPPVEEPQATEPPVEEPQPTEPAPERLTKAEAEAIALEHAGLTADQVTGLRSEYDREDRDYDIEFRSGDYEYDYTVHAYTGKILEHDTERDPIDPPLEEPKPTEPPVEEPQPTEPAPERLTKAEAEAIALEHAGLTADQVTGLRSEYDREDRDYDIEFRSGDYEYDYTVHAYTGKVLEHDRDLDPQPPTAGERLTEEQIRAIVLERAGLTVDQIRGWQIELDDEEPEYEVEFRSGGKEYSCTIHAQTGKILEWEAE